MIYSLFCILLTICISIRLLHLACKHLINNSSQQRKKILFWLLFFIVCVAYFVLNHVLYEFHPASIIIYGFILCSQILHNSNLAVSNFDSKLYWMYLSPRFLIFLYYRGCPNNLSGLKPYPICVAFSFTIYGISLIILYLQSVYGPTFFLPKWCMSKQYNYFIPIQGMMLIFENRFKTREVNHLDRAKINETQNRYYKKLQTIKKSNERMNLNFAKQNKNNLSMTEAENILEQSNCNLTNLSGFECSICFENLESEDEGTVSSNDIANLSYQVRLHNKLRGKFNKGFRMKTPCDHFFHTSKPTKYYIARNQKYFTNN